MTLPALPPTPRAAPARRTPRVRGGAGVSVARVRVARVRVASWTGRAAMSAVTSSGVPRVRTAGTHRTRVSEMRDAGAALRPPVPARRLPAPRRPTPAVGPG